jgi:hypothetical protein
LLGVATLAPEGASTDNQLLYLGCEFTKVVAKIDRAIDQGAELCDEWLDTLSHLDAEIVATPATTIVGLWVKARAACWARLGDLDTPDEATTDHRMALSIVRDLVRLHDPGLERLGALKQLVQNIESGAAVRSQEPTG